MIIENNGKLTPYAVAQKLYDYPNVGQLVYKRKKSASAESPTTTQLTILSLIAADILRLDIDEAEQPIAYCKISLNMQMATPHYLIDQHWTMLNHET